MNGTVLPHNVATETTVCTQLAFVAWLE